MIGIILRTDKESDALDENWQPEDIAIEEVNNAFLNTVGYVPTNNEFTHDKNDCLIHFTLDNLEKPKSITFSCAINSLEAKIINKIAKDLKAKIYDSEASDFIQL